MIARAMATRCLLAAGKFLKVCDEDVRQAEHLLYNVEAMGIETVTMNKLRDGDIAFGCQRGEQIEALKDEARFCGGAIWCARHRSIR